MRRQTKATNISPKVKETVARRDGGRCIICGRYGAPNAHYISRAQGGLGIEENIVTLCDTCHRVYDQTEAREDYRATIRQYLQSKYPKWDEKKLKYRKYSFLEEKV